MILVWWYVHVSSFPLLRVCCFCYSTIFIYASHPLMRSIYSCTILIYVLHLFFSFYVSAMYVLHLFMHRYLRCNHLCITVIHALHLFIYYTHSCITFIHASHSSMRRTHLCVVLIYASHLFICCTDFMHHTHSIMHCTSSCVVFIHVSLCLYVTLHLSIHVAAM